jgi:putrescine aminotransferase
MTTEEVIRRSQVYLDLISGKLKLTAADKKDLIALTLQNFDNFVNRGFIDYRKSVAEAEDYAAIEWSGNGSLLSDILGRKFIDCLGGFGIYNTGMRHPKIVQAVRDQLERMPLSSQELLDPLRGALGEMLGEIAPGDLQCCFFINNGTDAVEGAMKLARMYTKRSGFISTLGGFHGKSMGSLSLLGKASYRKPFEPLLDNIHFVPFGNEKALEEEVKKLKSLGVKIAAFVAEPVQGEAGAIIPPDDYFPKVRKICDAYGMLLILDEVQTGFGRTGKMFACEHWNVVPDIMCVAKSLGGGVMPLSAFISNKKIWSVLEKNPFIHSTTFGGNPLACAAGIAAINVILSEKLPECAAKRGEYFLGGLEKIQKKYQKYFTEVRGKGLLIGMDFKDAQFGYRVTAGLFKRGVLVAGTLIGVKTVRIEPALNIPYKFIDEVLEKLDDTLKELTKK